MFCDCDCNVGAVEFVQQNHEFIAAQTQHMIVFAYRLLQHACDRLQIGITCFVAQSVVDDLEVIEVDKQDGELVPLLFGCVHDGRKIFIHPVPVGQMSQRISECQLFELIFFFFDLSDIAQGHGQSKIRAYGTGLKPEFFLWPFPVDKYLSFCESIAHRSMQKQLCTREIVAAEDLTQLLPDKISFFFARHA